MTRDFTFQIPNSGQWYNLWDDFIARQIGFDPTFSNSPYLTNMVSSLEYQNQTPGANIQVSDNKKSVGFNLSGASWDRITSNANTIDLKNKNFMTDTPGATVYVAIIA